MSIARLMYILLVECTDCHTKVPIACFICLLLVGFVPVSKMARGGHGITAAFDHLSTPPYSLVPPGLAGNRESKKNKPLYGPAALQK